MRIINDPETLAEVCAHARMVGELVEPVLVHCMQWRPCTCSEATGLVVTALRQESDTERERGVKPPEQQRTHKERASARERDRGRERRKTTRTILKAWLARYTLSSLSHRWPPLHTYLLQQAEDKARLQREMDARYLNPETVEYKKFKAKIDAKKEREQNQRDNKPETDGRRPVKREKNADERRWRLENRRIKNGRVPATGGGAFG